MHLLLVQSNQIWIRRLLTDHSCRPTKKPGRYVPALTAIGDHRHRLLVVASEHADHRFAPVGLKLDAVAYPELEHFGVGPHLMQEPEALDYAIVEVDQLFPAEPVDVDLDFTSPSELRGGPSNDAQPFSI